MKSLGQGYERVFLAMRGRRRLLAVKLVSLRSLGFGKIRREKVGLLLKVIFEKLTMNDRNVFTRDFRLSIIGKQAIDFLLDVG